MPNKILELRDLNRIFRDSAGAGQDVDIDADFEELGYDSIMIMEIAGRINIEYGVSIDDDALVTAKTPRRLMELVNEG